MILAAEAEKEKQIREAEGEAEAIKNVQQATADGIRMVREAGADNAVLTLQAFEALKAVANGRATKLIIPSEIQGMAGLAASLKEIVADDKQPPFPPRVLWSFRKFADKVRPKPDNTN